MHAAEPPQLKIDQEQACRQLDYLGYRSGDSVYLRFFYHSDDPRKDNDRGRKLNQMRWKEAEAYQQDGRGVYVVVNGAGGGHEDKGIKQCAAIFCEWDDCPVAEQLLRWETVGFVEPTFTIYSGDKSAQPYWVFGEPLDDAEQWRELQCLLIEVMGADPSNKNPSRVFRLAGGWHVKPGREPRRTEIVQDSGIKYSYKELRDRLLEIKTKLISIQSAQQPLVNEPDVKDILELIGEYIPLRQCGADWRGDCPFCNAEEQFIVKQRYQTFECLSCQAGGDADNYHGSAADFLNKYRVKSRTTKTIRYTDIQVPVPELVPLELCLSKESRELLRSGVAQGGRNTGGAKLARDLIGTANYLQNLGQRVDGDPRQLLDSYASRCTPPLPPKEINSIWKSAEGDRPTPSCKDDGVQNCIRAWYWNTCIKPSQQNNSVKSNNQFSKNNSGSGSGNPPISSINLRDRVLEILGRSNLSTSDRKNAFIELAKSTGVHLREVEQLADAIESDLDFDAEAVEAKVNLPDLLRNHSQELNPSEFLWGDGGRLAAAMNATAAAMPTAVAMIFSTFIAASASRIGTSSRIVIKASAKYVQVCIFWIAVVSRSGTLKTPAQRVAIDPLTKLEVNSKKAYDEALEDYKEAQKNRKEGEAAPKKPEPRKRYLTKDSTLETLERIHGDNPRGFLYYRDELAGMTKAQNAFKPSGKGADQEAELDQWNGSALIVDRGDRQICLPETAVSRTGSVQYEVLQKLAGDHEDINGSMARWLLSAVKAPPRYFTLDDAPDTGISELLESLYKNLELLPVRDYLIDRDSQVIFKHWQNQLVDAELAENHPGLKLVYPKIEAYTARFALWLHCVNAILAGELPVPTIPGSTMQKAVALASFFLNQAKLIYAINSSQSGLTGRLLKLYQYAEGKSQGITPRQIKRNSRLLGSVTTGEILRECQMLVKDGFFRQEGEIFFAVGDVGTNVGSVGSDVGTPPTPKETVYKPSQDFVGNVGSVGTNVGTLPTPEETVYKPSQEFVGNVGTVGTNVGTLPTPEETVYKPSQEFVGNVGTVGSPKKLTPSPTEDLLVAGNLPHEPIAVGTAADNADNADKSLESTAITSIDTVGTAADSVPTLADSADNCRQPSATSAEVKTADVDSEDAEEGGDECLDPFEGRFEKRAQKALDAENVNQQPAAPAVEVGESEAIAPQPALEEPLKVGDRVTWDNCPPHFAWGNPFQITAIRGATAELDLVEKPVPLAQLRRVV